MDVLTVSSRIKALCKEQRIPVKKMLEDIKINRNFIYALEKSGAIPSADKFARIADYLDCSVDYLLGKTEKPTPENESGLTDEVEELIALFLAAPPALQEEESRDNMPENLQGSVRYEKASDVCDRLEDAIDSMEETIGNIEEATEV